VIQPYVAVGLVPTIRGARRRSDIGRNIDHLAELINAATVLGGLDLPVRLVAIPEGALQGYTDEILDLDHAEFARDGAIDIPGPETERLGRIAREHKVFIIATAKARHEEFPERFFNCGFMLNPDGDVVLRHHKVVGLVPLERSLTPHSVWDRWIELYGRTLDAFYPVADTEIGRIGVMMANEGSYPENARGLAMNGAEILYRGPLPSRSSDAFVVQNRARALDNNCYVLGMNIGPYYLTPDSETPIDPAGGQSTICDYEGRVVGELSYSGVSTWVHGTINIEALRDFRTRARWGSWMKDLTTEQYRLIYEREIYPPNLYLNSAPGKHDDYHRQVVEGQWRKLIDQGVYVAPSGEPET
jgi:predicted amidohydrolase